MRQFEERGGLRLCGKREHRMMHALLVSCLLATAALVNGAGLHPETEGYHHTVSHYGGGGSTQTHVRHNLNVYPSDDGRGAYVHQEPGRFGFGSTGFAAVNAHAPSVAQVLAHGGYGVGLGGVAAHGVGGVVSHGVGGVVSHGVGGVVAHTPAAAVVGGHGLYGAGLYGGALYGGGLYGGGLYGGGLYGGALYGHGLSSGALYGTGLTGGLYGTGLYRTSLSGGALYGRGLYSGLYGAGYGGLYGGGYGLYGAGYGGVYGAGYGTGLYGSGLYGSASLYGRPYSRSYQVRNTHSLRQYAGLDGDYLAHHPEVHHFGHETAHP
ncbi:uncharacterized protein LOC135388318 [Ornithodoros turicata]|uniref:uncharacterized protein LOC135388318 n=1 Tax=Ornithodoros turicata TaxID=34597 RepID=UPI003139AB67